MIYLDHAASTPLWPSVASKMSEVQSTEYANPSSLHAAARSARKVIEEAREVLAAAVGARVEEVIFTGSGTESDNMAVIGAARHRAGQGRKRILVSAVEHHAVLSSAKSLRDEGFDVELTPVDSDGALRLDSLEAMLDEQVALVSIMAANNETGVIQPVQGAVELARAVGALTHTDAVQAFSFTDITALETDLLTVSAHKIGGPKGVGALVARRGARIKPLLFGGGHERGLRPGTMNTAGIAGFGEAVKQTQAKREAAVPRVASLRDRLTDALLYFGGIHVTGQNLPRLASHLHVRINGVDADSMLMLLDAEGVCASSASACSSGAAQMSHVLAAMGVSKDEARGALRFSLGHSTTQDEVDKAASAVSRAVSRLRGKS